MILPNFLTIGAQKAGTTWIHRMLSQHPDIYMPKVKELHFFSHKSKIIEKGKEGYSKEYFSEYNGEKAIGEATPGYFWNSDVYPEWCNKPRDHNNEIPKTVHDFLGSKVKLILTLRDPVDRAISAYFHHLLRMNRLTPDQNIIKAGHKFGIVHMGFYYEHLKKWLEYYDLDSFCILIYENDISKKRKEALEKIYRFLEVESSFVPDQVDKVFYKGLDRLRIDDNYYIPDPDFNKADLREDSLDGWVQVISAEDVEKLGEIYKEDVMKLSEFLNKDLSVWQN